jgi:hypothetical protein
VVAVLLELYRSHRGGRSHGYQDMSPLGTKYIRDTDHASTDDSTDDAITLSPFQTLAFTTTTGSTATPPTICSCFGRAIIGAFAGCTVGSLYGAPRAHHMRLWAPEQLNFAFALDEPLWASASCGFHENSLPAVHVHGRRSPRLLGLKSRRPITLLQEHVSFWNKRYPPLFLDLAQRYVRLRAALTIFEGLQTRSS